MNNELLFVMLKKFTLSLLIFFFLFSLAGFSLACKTDNDCQNLEPDKEAKRTIACVETKTGEKECVRLFEIVYPKIGEKEITVTKIVKEGLPIYIEYIFTLAVGIIGFVIFGVLIYSGILYLTSAGNINQTTDARDRIQKAFLGGLLLLVSVLIFNTINPQLKIMKVAPLPPPEQMIESGIYICNYKPNNEEIDDVKAAWKKYTTEEGKEQIKAARELSAIIAKGCLHLKASIPNLSLEGYEITENNLIFTVPSISISIDPITGTKKKNLEYNYGIILHEKERPLKRGRCKVYPDRSDSSGKVYEQLSDFSAQDLNFHAYSLTLFHKLSKEPAGKGVTLYENFSYNESTPASTSKSFIVPADNDMLKINSNELAKLKDNARSISFAPPDAYLALLFENDDFKGDCAVLYGSSDKFYPSLIDGVLESGGTGCDPKKRPEKCKPELGSMIIIKGQRRGGL